MAFLFQKKTSNQDAEHLGGLSDAHFTAWKFKYARDEDEESPDCCINAFDFDRVIAGSDEGSGGENEGRNVESSKESDKRKGPEACFQLKKAFLLTPDEQERHEIEHKTVSVTRSSLRGSVFLLQLDLRQMSEKTASLCSCHCVHTTSPSSDALVITSARKEDRGANAEMACSTGPSSNDALPDCHGERLCPVVTVADSHLLVTWPPPNEVSDSVNRQTSESGQNRVEAGSGTIAKMFKETVSAGKTDSRMFLFPFPFPFCSLFCRALFSIGPDPLLTVIIPTDVHAVARLESCVPSICMAEGPTECPEVHTDGTALVNNSTTLSAHSCANFEFETKQMPLPVACSVHSNGGWGQEGSTWTESEIANAYLDTVF
ncbi:conserved hypothetical protein [Neospora caninum Liverpool]|uniref:Uncharacterized protein n=1 Tax=Neospora caninum (strain Liverpool) TaxID=572307 RepID=F0VIL8_NEOCL|nr:conserved hypothetical protein [Neospora caninum Liverpool]CBZ53579.1 conserved hypothetical protein [Neospora caninum Liverpool]CEL67567.1 TPA: hypothetical protein BN1204_033660 [Neospora caninum Liverpool]|eukprot:XP_003883611.1 conserved hypothetical protein [Neospora caninum Liverpool]